MTYGFLNRLKRHAGEAGGLRIVVGDDRQNWVELAFSEGLVLGGERIEQAVEQLRALLPEGAVTLDTRHLRFETGQRFLDYVAETKAEYRRGDVEP